MKSILCIEDNPEIQILVSAALNTYNTVPASSLHEARALLPGSDFSLILLDLELPDGDGLRFLTELRAREEKDEETPVFVLTGKPQIGNKVIAFSLGVDDFVTKPFDPIELKARVDARIRKAEAQRSMKDTIRLRDLTISISRQRVQLVTPTGYELIPLTSLEFKLLHVLARSPDRVFSRAKLLDLVWGAETNITDRTVDTHIGHLRKKLAKSAVKIETVINEGYRLVP